MSGGTTSSRSRTRPASRSRWRARTCSTSSTPPARPPNRRASCTPPPAICSASAATHRWVFDIKDDDIYWAAADIGWVTGHTYIVYGPLANGTTGVMYEGTPDFPIVGALVGDHRAVQGHDPLHRADRDSRPHEAGRPARREARSLFAPACSARSASRSTPRRGSGTTSTSAQGRCPIVDTWWQTETGGIMISPIPEPHHDQARLGDLPASRHQGRRGR